MKEGSGTLHRMRSFELACPLVRCLPLDQVADWVVHPAQGIGLIIVPRSTVAGRVSSSRWAARPGTLSVASLTPRLLAGAKGVGVIVNPDHPAMVATSQEGRPRSGHPSIPDDTAPDHLIARRH
jgi:hypothetical protein